MTFGIDIKEKLLEVVSTAVKNYDSLPTIETKFDEPILGYVYSYNPMFKALLDENMSIHPKQIYRPGYTVIVYFVPFGKEILESNRACETVSAKWKTAYDESIMLSAHINGRLREALDDIGRLTSGTNTPNDWDSETHAPVWNHKLAAYLAGMGTFGTCGSLTTKKGFAGTFGSVITDMKIEPSCQPELDEKNCEQLIKDIKRNQQYSSTPDILPLTEEKINVCPCGAISKKGVDAEICESFCKTLGMNIPSPDACGKCF